MPIKKKHKKDDYDNEDYIDDDKDEEKSEFSDDFDIIKDVTDVHEKKKFGLNKNFVLMKGGEGKLIEFVTKQHLVAIKSYNLLPHKPTAKKAYDLITAELEDRAIMGRNQKGNMILTGIFARGMTADQRTQLETPEQKTGIIGGTIKKVKSFLTGKKEVKEKEESIIN